MPVKQPNCEILSSGGLSFTSSPPNSNYRALCLESSENRLYWESTYQNILRLNKDFSDFFPNAEFADNGNQVTFTKYINSLEVLSKSRPMRPGESISRSEWERFLNSWHGFKALAEQPNVPEDVAKFIKTFGPPPFDIFPSAYRIYKPHWYSKPRLVMLWGLEPASPSEIPNAYDADEVVSQMEACVEHDTSQGGFNFIRLIKFLVLGLVALVLILVLLWLLIPMPIADFQVSPKVNKPTKISNTSQLSKPNSNYGVTSYAWIIEKGSPNESNEFEPVVSWKSTGPSKVTLEARRSILGGLLYKKDEKTKSINVTAEPVVVDSETPKDLPYQFGLENKPPVPNLAPRGKDDSEKKILKATELLNPSMPNEALSQNQNVTGADQKQMQKEKARIDNPSHVDATNSNKDNLVPKSDVKKPSSPQLNNLNNSKKDATPKDSLGSPPGNKSNTLKQPGLIKPKPKLQEDSASIPRISIISQSMISDGSESQKIEFSIESQSNIELNSVSIDGLDVDLAGRQKKFVSVLKKGVHHLELSYTNLDGNSDTIIQEINVDSRPDNKLTPPIKKFKKSDLESPEESQPKLPEENFNKKLA